jgi:hypothetical protein
VSQSFSTASLGSHIVRFRGADGSLAHEDTITITILADPPNLPPSVSITQPTTSGGKADIWADDGVDGGGWYKEVTLSASATDPEDGVLGATGRRWVVKKDGDTVFNEAGISSPTVRLRADPGQVSTRYDATVTVEDSTGQRASDTIVIYVLQLI